MPIRLRTSVRSFALFVPVIAACVTACAGIFGIKEGLPQGEPDGGPVEAGSADGSVPIDSDAGISDDAATRNLEDPAAWTSYRPTPVDPSVVDGFAGATFDGRYLLLPTTGRSFFRFDTTQSMTSSAAWKAFDMGRLVTPIPEFESPCFDQHFVYVPSSAHVYRFDSRQAPDTLSAWEDFDPTRVDSFESAGQSCAFDGRWVHFTNYLTAQNYRNQLRFDTQADGGFGDVASWSRVDVSSLSPNGRGYGARSAVFDGTYLYLVPFYESAVSGYVERLTVARDYNSTDAWTGFDLTSVDPTAKGFDGATSDGRYIYFVPSLGNGSTVARYDTRQSFTEAAAWSTFDTSPLGSAARVFSGAVFDGTHVYFVPRQYRTLLRYDVRKPFDNASSWEAFDLKNVDPTATNFHTGAFDGQAVYLLPQASEDPATHARTVGPVLRFDIGARRPIPTSYKGSFY